jgi:hypothetical protein
MPKRGLELGSWLDRHAALPCGLDDREREWVLRIGLDRRGDAQDLALVDPWTRDDAGESRAAHRQGPGLVEDYDVEFAGPLERTKQLQESIERPDPRLVRKPDPRFNALGLGLLQLLAQLVVAEQRQLLLRHGRRPIAVRWEPVGADAASTVWSRPE